MVDSILYILPQTLSLKIKNIGTRDGINEIRLRVNRDVIVITSKIEIVIDYIITIKDLLEILIKISKNSIYAIQDDINNGFVVIDGGHRIGVCGEVVMNGSKIKNIKNINGMNIRIARQIVGCADKLLPSLIEDNLFTNTLIVSAPGCGKTTLLRDVIRQVSNGVDSIGLKSSNVGLVDERGEIASVSQGIPGLDIGMRTDVISNCTKSLGIKMLVRSMGVAVIATDEIGSLDDVEAIKYASCSGVSMLFTMHGKDLQDIRKKQGMQELFDEGVFRNIIVLSNSNGPGTIKSIYKIDGLKQEVV